MAKWRTLEFLQEKYHVLSLSSDGFPLDTIVIVLNFSQIRKVQEVKRMSLGESARKLGSKRSFLTKSV
jgi:hypothetical protein